MRDDDADTLVLMRPDIRSYEKGDTVHNDGGIPGMDNRRYTVVDTGPAMSVPFWRRWIPCLATPGWVKLRPKGEEHDE